MAREQQTEITQLNYRETAYQDQSWEIVGEQVDHSQFVPLEMPILPLSVSMTDKMFADFGGISSDKREKHFHSAADDIKSWGERGEQQKRDEAERARKQAAELDAAVRKAFEDGKIQGRTHAEQEAKTRDEALRERVKTILGDLSKQFAEQREVIERQAVTLALAIADKIIGYAVEINPEYLGKIMREALGLSGSATIKRIRVSAQDMEFIEVVGIGSMLGEAGQELRFEKDDSVRSGCIVETSAGEIDYRLDEAFERMREAIVKVSR